MHRLPPPKFGAKVVFATCISHITDTKLKRNLTAICDEIGRCDTRYRAAGRKAELFKLVAHDKVGKVSCEDMKKIYTSCMAKKRAAGRFYYDKLRGSAPDGRCPLCGQPRVSTLDHHLPKAEFPSLVVTPFNLIPACRDCNTVKLAGLATNADKQTFHPYFDNVESVTWLKAKILQTKPAVAQFYVDGGKLPKDMAKRAESHFIAFQLEARYASQAATELVGIRHRMMDLLKKGGSIAVKTELQFTAASWAKDKKNCWQAALYTALAGDDWYCQGGCKAK